MLREYEERDIFSPASGRVISVRYTGNKVHIAIFLNFWDDHVQYAPVGGVVTEQYYQAGSNWPALFRESCTNESMVTYIDNPDLGLVSVRQISGILFRRIENNVSVGRQIVATQPIGQILFGSRVDIVFTVGHGTVLKVKKGDRLHGGRSIIGTYLGID